MIVSFFPKQKEQHFHKDDKLVLEFAFEEDHHVWSLSWSNFIFVLFFQTKTYVKTIPMIMSANTAIKEMCY